MALPHDLAGQPGSRRLNLPAARRSPVRLARHRAGCGRPCALQWTCARHKPAAVALEAVLGHDLADPRISSAIPRFHGARRSIKVLPVDLPDLLCPVVIMTLKNRTLNPVVERFIAHMRDFTRPMCHKRAITKA
jgi:DNA-binding transcriptional LysR family regulator